MGLVGGREAGFTVQGSTGTCEHHPPDPMSYTALEEVQRTSDVHVGIMAGIAYRFGYVGVGGMVDDDVGVSSINTSIQSVVTDVDLVKRGCGGEVLAPAGGQVVDNRDLLAEGYQAVAYV